MKLSGATPIQAPATPDTTTTDTTAPDESSDDLDFGSEEPTQDTSSEKPFDDTPFDAGVEADEDTDPKKFIEQLTGKLGQSLRKYNEEQGQADFELEKFAINSLLAASHTGQMDPEDQKDIIKKVKTAGNDSGESMTEPEDNEENTDTNDSEDYDTNDNEDAGNDTETNDDDNLFEIDDQQLNEIVLQDWKAEILVNLYDTNEDVQNILTNLTGYGSNKINQKRFMYDLQHNYDNDEILELAQELIVILKEMNIEVPKELSGIFSPYNPLGESLFLKNPKKNNMFQEGSNDILDEEGGCWSGYERVKGTKKFTDGSCKKIKEESKGLWANIHAKKERGEKPAKPSDEDYPDKKQWDKLTKEGEGESNNYMFFNNLKTIHEAINNLLEMDANQIDQILSDGHGWALDHLATSADDIDEVYHFLSAALNGNESDSYDGETEGGYQDEYGSVETIAISEAEYKGKKVKLGKPTHGDVKKFKVYVKNSKGNVIKVNFGDPNMEIKRDNPERKKSFRARHKCSKAKDRTTPKYWSCKMWSNKPVSKIVGENFEAQEKTSIFVDREILRSKIRETFNQDNMQQETKPLTRPETKPVKPAETKPAETKPNRINKPFLPEVAPGTVTQPKAVKDGKNNQ